MHQTRSGGLMSEHLRVRLVHLLPTCGSIVDSQLFLEPELEKQWTIFEISNSHFWNPPSMLYNLYIASRPFMNHSLPLFPHPLLGT